MTRPPRYSADRLQIILSAIVAAGFAYGGYTFVAGMLTAFTILQLVQYLGWSAWNRVER